MFLANKSLTLTACEQSEMFSRERVAFLLETKTLSDYQQIWNERHKLLLTFIHLFNATCLIFINCKPYKAKKEPDNINLFKFSSIYYLGDTLLTRFPHDLHWPYMTFTKSSALFMYSILAIHIYHNMRFIQLSLLKPLCLQAKALHSLHTHVNMIS